MNRSALLALCITSSLAAAACSTVYRMPEVKSASISEIAVLEEIPDTKEFVGVSAVDGRFRGLGFINRYELAPGTRTLTVRLIKAGYIKSDPLKLRFTAAAGETYQLRYEIRPTSELSGTWAAWIVNKRSGMEVSEVAN